MTKQLRDIALMVCSVLVFSLWLREGNKNEKRYFKLNSRESRKRIVFRVKSQNQGCPNRAMRQALFSSGILPQNLTL